MLIQSRFDLLHLLRRLNLVKEGAGRLYLGRTDLAHFVGGGQLLVSLRRAFGFDSRTSQVSQEVGRVESSQLAKLHFLLPRAVQVPQVVVRRILSSHVRASGVERIGLFATELLDHDRRSDAFLIEALLFVDSRLLFDLLHEFEIGNLVPDAVRRRHTVPSWTLVQETQVISVDHMS